MSEIARDINGLTPDQLTVQDFRNELNERSFVELHRMQTGGDTYASNLINGLINKLDWFYGTEHQMTISEVKAHEKQKESVE